MTCIIGLYVLCEKSVRVSTRLKIFTRNSEYVFTIQRAIHTVKRYNSKCFIFFRLMPSFQLNPLSSTQQSSVSTRIWCSCLKLTFNYCTLALYKNVITNIQKFGLVIILSIADDKSDAYNEICPPHYGKLCGKLRKSCLSVDFLLSTACKGE